MDTGGIQKHNLALLTGIHCPDTALRELVSTGMLESGKSDTGKAKPFNGWKVKIEFEAKATDGTPYRSEYWFILDKEANCVVKSFEIPLALK